MGPDVPVHRLVPADGRRRVPLGVLGVLVPADRLHGSLLLVMAVLALSLGCAASGPPTLSPADVEAHVRFLASDELAARQAGTEGARRAARYVADVFADAGLEPAGDEGTFFQVIEHRVHEVLGPIELVLEGPVGGRRVAEHGVDFRFLRGPPVDGAFDVLVVGEEDDVPSPPDAGTALVLAGSARAAMAKLAAADGPDGAAWALTFIAGPEDEGDPRPPPTHVVGRPGNAPLLMLRGGLLEAVVAGELTSGRIRVSRGPPMEAMNVVGLLRGVGTAHRPELVEEAVVFTAHYDHIGVAAEAPGDAPGDRVYNGAGDNASGVAAVLELAEAFAAGEPPARTLVFVAVTAEEHGLLGSAHYVEHPAWPLERTVANVNFEMIGLPDELAGGRGALFLTGFERTNLGPRWREAGLPVVPDPRPRLRLFQRSDNYSFARRGVVGQTLSSGGEDEHYHRVTDEADRLDWDHLAACVDVAWRASRELADGRLRAEWVEGGAPDSAR